jgi:hypothetical protein
MNAKQLKILAEAHFFTGKELTDEEYNSLKESKYSHLVKRGINFDKLFEYALPTNEENHELPKVYQKRRYAGFNIGVNKNDIDHLIDMIEDRFDLGVDNTSTKKYANVNVDELKSFILKHGDDEGLGNNTTEHIQRIINKPGVDVYDIMKRLYALGY